MIEITEHATKIAAQHVRCGKRIWELGLRLKSKHCCASPFSNQSRSRRWLHVYAASVSASMRGAPFNGKHVVNVPYPDVYLYMSLT